MANKRIHLSIDEIKPGMVIRTKAATTQTRMVYKVVTKWDNFHKVWTSTIWSILGNFSPIHRNWQEKPIMTTNSITSVTHLTTVVDRQVIHTPLTVEERDPAKGHDD